MCDVADYPQIVPKNAPEARGIDFCGTKDSYYIIRSDLGAYMRCSNFNTGSDITIFSLAQACQWGDHYLATSSKFYIVKGSEYRRVNDMNTDNEAVVYSLHPNCQGGSGYYSAFGRFYIVFADRGVYRRVKNMNTDKDAVEYSIHEAFKDGLFFWGVNDYVYCLKPVGVWSVTYHRSTNMNKNDKSKTFSVNKSVLNFIPGGVAQTYGKAFGYWEQILSFSNDSNLEVEWERAVKATVGFGRKKMSSIENNWSIEMGAEYESGGLSEELCKYQFSLKARYGGRSVRQEEDWSEFIERSENLKLCIAAHASIYVWQYQQGFGKEKNLFSSKLEITKDPNPPSK